ncbi:hypothetical protein G7068_04915 [Leucobacter viscericola]|uniref:Alpha/beta hydrolase n=1 Tax=Leucobacter viscericola TaxID=2714935 RepID=A0A6G7XDJ8_9MICO|nr:hypothetical protein [Leucobacter viscericola]QIK62623.1 hypothetical protein G7068_04915 [Leucobacter viscericola]
MSIEYDDGAAATLSAVSTNVADALRAQASGRSQAASEAATDFSGAYAKLFTQVCFAESQDRGRLAGVLYGLSDQLAEVRQKAKEEVDRQALLSAWEDREALRVAERDADLTDPLAETTYRAAAANDSKPSEIPIAAPAISAAFEVQERKHTGGKDGSGKTSADPARLRHFVSQSRGFNNALEGQLTSLQNAWVSFTSTCSWVLIGNSTFLTGFTGLLRENQSDVVWVEHCAQRFEAAGSGKSLTDTELTRSLKKLDKKLGTNRTHPLLDSLFGNILKPGGLKPTPTAQEVLSWWEGLSEVEREQLISEAPLVIGNLDGIPIKSRVEANALTAEYFAQVPGISDLEKTYWESVANGTRSLVTSDPENSRIVEMIGVITPSTKRTLTYVPGTSAGMRSFFDRSIQEVANHMATQTMGETVAFVYKDGPWATWVGDRRNSSPDFTLARGEELAKFQRDVIGLDTTIGGIPKNAIAHSAGMTILSGAELSGAEFDHVISIAGSYVLKDWKPNEVTNYDHVQYDQDAINALDDRTQFDTPHTRPEIFTPHIFDGGGQTPADAHSRIAQGPQTNDGPLKKILEILESPK